MTLGDTSIAVSKKVKSLGVKLDETLFFNSHVDNVCKAAHFHIGTLRHIRRCIDDETARTVACSMVGARLDYCNSILYGTSTGNLGRIQRVIKTMARVVSGVRKRDHITPVLADLHWLPIASRNRFKVAIQTYKTLTTKKPEYLADLFSFQTASRSLRSSSTNRLHVDDARTSFASRVFFVMWRRLFGTLFPFTWLTFHNLWILSKTAQNILKQSSIPSGRHWWLPARGAPCTCPGIHLPGKTKCHLHS